MTHFFQKRIPIVAILLLVTLLLDMSAGKATAQTVQSAAPLSFRGFFERIFRDDEWEDPPTISRGELCLLAPARSGRETLVWHQTPVFVWQGEITRMEIVDSVTNAVVWEYAPLPEQISVVYEGEALRAGRSYLWRVYKGSASPTAFPPFTILSSVRRQLIANGLAVAESKVEGTERSRVARTEYFAIRGLPTDALQSLFLIESTDEELIEAQQETVSRLCE